MTTTLNAIKSHHPCSDGWTRLLTGLGKATADDEPLSFVRILEINGIADAIWALRCCGDRTAVLTYAADCAEHVLPLYERRCPDDTRVRDCIAALRGYIAGTVTVSELHAAAYAARCAAADAADAAYAAYAAYAAAYAADAAADAADAADADAEREWQAQRYREIFG